MHTVKIEWIYECLGAYIRPALPGVITLCVAMAIGREGGRFFSSDLGAYESGRRGCSAQGQAAWQIIISKNPGPWAHAKGLDITKTKTVTLSLIPPLALGGIDGTIAWGKGDRNQESISTRLLLVLLA